MNMKKVIAAVVPLYVIAGVHYFAIENAHERLARDEADAAVTGELLLRSIRDANAAHSNMMESVHSAFSNIHSNLAVASSNDQCFCDSLVAAHRNITKLSANVSTMGLFVQGFLTNSVDSLRADVVRCREAQLKTMRRVESLEADRKARRGSGAFKVSAEVAK